MNGSENNYCVILAGGKGRRLWPCSREKYPKQFIDFFGVGRTLLQQTYDRFLKVLPKDHIFINTNQVFLHLVKEQLPEVDDDHIMAEPIWRNTGPSVAWGCHRVNHLNPKANVVFSPSDQVVHNETAFCQNIQEGFEFVSNHSLIMAIGVKPSRPEPGYGYIQMGDEIGHDLFSVKSFTEKPARDFARMFVDSNEFLWNTGIFISNSRYMLDCFDTFLPVVLRTLRAEKPDFTTEEENAFIREHFPIYPNLTLDDTILEKISRVCVMKGDFGWADMGTWHSMYESMQKSEDDNVVVDSDVILENCRNNVIKLPKGKLGVINGLDGYIVADHGNVLLICKKEDSSALVRKYVNEVLLKKGSEYI